MNDEQVQVIIVEISKMNLQENDYLFIKFPDGFPEAGMEYAQKTLKRQFPELRFLFYNVDIEFKVVHQEERNENRNSV